MVQIKAYFACYIQKSAILIAFFILFLLVSITMAIAEDVTPPQLKTFSFTPASVDVSNQSQVINFTGRATDDISGVIYFLVQLRGPSGVQYAEGFASTPTSGNSFDGVYNFSATIPKSAEPGTWFVQRIELYDKLGNGPVLYENKLITMGFPTKIQVTSTTGDTTAPQLKAFSFTPTSVDVGNQSQIINFTGRATDDISGVIYFLVQLRGPSGVQYAEGFASTPTSGNSFDGVYNFSATISKSAETGTWFVQRIELYDKLGNGPVLYENQLKAMGFPTKIQVTNDSKLSVTFTGNGGGTVTSLPSGISCTGSCSAIYPVGTNVTLMATHDSNSLLLNWSDCDSVSGNNCTVTMNSERNVAAYFDYVLPVRISDIKLDYFTLISKAYSVVQEGSAIQAREFLFFENLNFTQNKNISIVGGFDLDYSGRTGYTTLKGSLAIANGCVTVDRVVIR